MKGAIMRTRRIINETYDEEDTKWTRRTIRKEAELREGGVGDDTVAEKSNEIRTHILTGQACQTQRAAQY